MGATELKGSKMKFGSLFAGIGGLDLGLERAGMECRWQVEIDDYCNKILSKHWPNVPKYRDVREVGKENLEAVDLICGGFPCQDISIAGKGIGIEGERSGLWKEFARIIGELRPRYALIENVPMLSRRGLNVVLADLAEKGYDAEWCDIRASDLGAYHKRERLFIVAHPNVPGGGASPNGGDLDRVEEDKGRQELTLPVLGGFCLDVAYTKSTVRGGGRLYGTTPKRNVSEPSHEEQSMVWREADGCCGMPREKELADSHNERLQGRRQDGRAGEIFSQEAIGAFRCRNTTGNGIWARDPAEENPETESFVGRVADGVPNRVDRLKALGNAVVPQVAEYIGRCILVFDQ